MLLFFHVTFINFETKKNNADQKEVIGTINKIHNNIWSITDQIKSITDQVIATVGQ